MHPMGSNSYPGEIGYMTVLAGALGPDILTLSVTPAGHPAWVGRMSAQQEQAKNFASQDRQIPKVELSGLCRA